MAYNNDKSNRDRVTDPVSDSNYNDILQDSLDAAFNSNNALGNSVLNQWLNPGEVQERQFGQQVALQMMQNAWNSAPEQINRMKEAGLNPALLQGNNLPQSPSVSSPSTVPAQSPFAASADLGSAASSLASAYATISQNNPIIGKILAETKESLSNSGYTDENARGLAIANTYLPQEKQFGLALLRQNVENLNKQYDLYDKQIDWYDGLIRQIDQQIEESKATISLMDMQALVEQKRGLLLDSQKFQLDWENGIRSQLGIDPHNSLENNLFLLSFTNRGLFNAGIDTLSAINYKRALGEFTADQDTAFLRFRNQVEGSKAGELTSAKDFLKLDNSKYLFKVLADMLFRSDGKLEGLAHRLISLLGTEFGIGEDELQKLISDAYNAGQ